MVAGREVTPGDSVATERLMRYWTVGPGALRIGWGTPGDFARCILNIQQEVTEDGRPPLSDRMIKGLCSNLHRRAIGTNPSDHNGDGKRDH